jgi:hypothetical protein
MKNKIILFILFLFQFLFSQTPGKIEYAPVGAKWVYELNTIIYPFTNPLQPVLVYDGYIEYSVVKDTTLLIQNQNTYCKKIMVTDFKSDVINASNFIPYNCGNRKYFLTFLKNDTVFLQGDLYNSNSPSYYINVFRPIVILHKDTVNKGFYLYQAGFNAGCPTSSVNGIQIPDFPCNLKISKIDTILLLNDTLKKYSFYGYNNLFYIENIGFTNLGFVPNSYIGGYPDYSVLPFRLNCYYDPTNGWIHFNYEKNCYEHNTVSIKDYDKNKIIKKVFYDFERKMLYIDTGFEEVIHNVKITDVLGKNIYLDKNFNSIIHIDLVPGVYFIMLNHEIIKFCVK